MTSSSHIKKPFFIRIIRLIVPVVIIAAGVFTAQYLYDTRPVASRGRPQIPPPLVETAIMEKQDHRIILTAMGAVMPSRSITLKSRVGGFVETISPQLIPGGVFKKAQVMLTLEKKDFELDVARKKAALDRLSASLRLEMGRQEVAREEMKILQKDAGSPILDADLALRGPQMAQIKADIAAARADLDQARLNLARTTIKAPFNCLITAVHVQTGSQISAQDALAELSGTDAFWVKAAVPVEHLKWIWTPSGPDDTGSPATITDQNNTRHQGRVIRLLGELGSETRLATLLITIDDPLGLSRPVDTPLLLNNYVKVAIHGEKISDVIALPRPMVRSQNQVWVAADGHLDIRTIDIVWRDSDHVFVTKGLETGDAVIQSDMSSPVEGMALRVHNKDRPAAAGTDTGNRP
ncbi:MAG: efflux RND transporter periplasmic adaptor subunit [Desulfotignum sp.]|nr:efflux RND transporter periplasmic adaptor subunit [Desulfotignum sp.]MCF8126072.1 efflux RND transporter periplasmic adaptor subunit [Desulfotignum sp.]